MFLLSGFEIYSFVKLFVNRLHGEDVKSGKVWTEIGFPVMG